MAVTVDVQNKTVLTEARTRLEINRQSDIIQAMDDNIAQNTTWIQQWDTLNDAQKFIRVKGLISNQAATTRHLKIVFRYLRILVQERNRELTR